MAHYTRQGRRTPSPALQLPSGWHTNGVQAKGEIGSDRRPRSSQNDSSSSSRGGSYYKASEGQNPARRDRSVVQEDGGARDGSDGSNVGVVSGTSHTSAILGSVVFDLIFLNEVTQLHDTIRNIHVQVLDSCIAVIISRPVIRENHLVRKIPLYFDEGARSKPNPSQSVLPVTTLSTTRAKCRGTQSCVTCAPFVALGYDDTLCTRPDRATSMVPCRSVRKTPSD